MSCETTTHGRNRHGSAYQLRHDCDAELGGAVARSGRYELLAFAQELDVALAELDVKFEVKPGLAREILQHEDDNPNRPEYWKTDEPHPHWLERLGYRRFQQN